MLRPQTDAGYWLLHQGSLAFAELERNGIRIDTAYLAKATAETDAEIKAQEASLRETDEWKAWRRHYADKANFYSRAQLGHVLFNLLGHDAASYTPSGKPQADEGALERIGGPFCAKLLRLYKNDKLRGTYFAGLAREVEGEYLHPFFNLHTVETHRSSSDSPNFQNLPIRDKEMGAKLRRCFVPRPGRRLVEIDFKAIEVRVAACYHKDPVMLQYIRDDHDMHFDMAMELFKLPKEEVTKDARQFAKNGFVFPAFYGDYYCSMARDVWASIGQYHLKTKSGQDLYDWLTLRHGIGSLGACDPDLKAVPGTFEHHVQQVEDGFWNKRFMVYNRWRREWYKTYRAHGYFDTLTGFRIQGVFPRNFVINCPVQGSAFHCLLWSIIELQKELRKRKMRTLLVGQIHDSALGDVPDDELDDFTGLAKEVMTERLPKAWPWLITPLAVEADVTPVGGSWHDKEAIAL